MITLDVIVSALVLTGKATPTPVELTAALQELYAVGNVPTVQQLLDTGQLCYCPDGQRLRLPPLTPKELQQRRNKLPEASMVPVTIVPARFSFYEGGISNTTPTAVLTPAGLHEILTSPRYRTATEALREAGPGTAAYKEAKKSLDYVTPAGVFSHRSNAGLRSISGLMVLDFDHLPNVDAARTALLADELLAQGLLMLFTSPSGIGLKAIVWTDPAEDHLANFRAYANYLTAHYSLLGLTPDEAGKDLARACFVPFDPTAWLAPSHDTSDASEQ